MQTSILAEKSKFFALEIIKLYQALQRENEFVLSKQDLDAKICIAFKEAHETAFWLELLEKSSLTNIDLSKLQVLCEELIKMLASTKLTTEQNLNYKK